MDYVGGSIICVSDILRPNKGVDVIDRDGFQKNEGGGVGV